jgi:hypothetical protein
MRKSVLFLLFCLFMSVTFAEDNLQKTKTEEAVFTKGFLYKQEVFSVDNIPAFRLDAIKMTNLEKFSTTTGLRVVHKVQIGKELKTYNNYIDAEEIDGLLTTLQYMKTILKSKTTPGSYTEIKFTTKSGFQLMLNTVLNTQNKLDWNFTAQTDIYNDKTIELLSNDDIEKLQKTLEQAKGKL